MTRQTETHRSSVRILHTFLFGMIMLLPTVCQGQAKCPWLTKATAQGILGGAVTVTVDVNAKGAGDCEFSSQQGSTVHQLRISVGLMTDIPKEFPAYLAQCPPKSPRLRAVGNEAVLCSVQGQVGQYIERIVSRVRDQAFVVSVGSSVQDDPSMTQAMRREKANLVAEQVAGILF